MKNPNGYGSITRLQGKRRRPYMIREGSSGKQKVIGYAETRKQALQMLAEYNKTPWNLDAATATLGEVYAGFLENKNISTAIQRQSKTAHNYISDLDGTIYAKIKSYMMQRTIDDCGKGYATKNAIRALWTRLDNYALELEIISRKNSDLLHGETIAPAPRQIFTEAEIKTLWEHQRDEYADAALVLLYTGFRSTEFLSLKKSDFDAKEMTLTGGVKTAAGKNRIVPVHPRIAEIVKARAAAQGTYLFEINGKKIDERLHRNLFAALMESLGMTHIPHECRHTFRTRLDNAGANHICIDRIMGHKSPGTGENTYTHKTLDQLRQAITLLA